MYESPLLPDPSLDPLLPRIKERWNQAIESRCETGMVQGEFLEVPWVALATLHLTEIEADEGTVWLFDEKADALVPVFNSGPSADRLVAKFRQPITQGVVSTVFCTEMGLIENRIHQNQDHDQSADEATSQKTAHMVVVPFYFGGETRGVISAVKLSQNATQPPSDPAPFSDHSLSALSRLAYLLGQLVDAAELKTALNL